MKNKTIFYTLCGLIYATQALEGLPGLSLFNYLKNSLHMNPSQVMYLGALTSICWNFKIVQGILVDRFFSRKIFILLSIIFSILSCLILGLIIPHNYIISFLATMLIISSTSTCFRDVAIDGISCVEGRKENNQHLIQTLQWTSITIASIIASLAGGWIADHFTYKVAYLSLIPVYIILGVAALFYREGRNKNIIKYKPALVSYLAMFKNKNFVLACLFILFYNFNPSFGTILMYTQIDKFHFTMSFMGTIGAISSLTSLIGAFVFFKIGNKINIKKWIYISVFLGAITTLMYLYYTPTTAIIYPIVMSSIGFFLQLMILTLMAKQALLGLESTSFAILCSCTNLAGTLSTLAGAKLYPMIGLNWLIILSAATSFLCLPLISKLEIKHD